MTKIGSVWTNTPRLNVINSASHDPILSKRGEEVIYRVSHEGEQTFLQLQQAYVPIDVEVVPSIEFEQEEYAFLEGTNSEIYITRNGDLSQNSVVSLYMVSLDPLKTFISVEDLINAPRVAVIFHIGESQKTIKVNSLLNYEDISEFGAISLILRPFINSQIGLNSVATIDIVNLILKVTYSGFCSSGADYFIDYKVIPKQTFSGYCSSIAEYSIDYLIESKVSECGFCSLDFGDDYDIGALTLYCPQNATDFYTIEYNVSTEEDTCNYCPQDTIGFYDFDQAP